MQPFEYQKLVNIIESQIAKQYWVAGEKLPSIRHLATQYQLSKNTVIKALHTLEAIGKIEAQPKIGYFVSSQISQPNLLKSNQSLIEPSEVSVPKLFLDIMNRGAAFDILPGAEQAAPSNHLINLNRHISRAMRLQPMDKAMYYDTPFGNSDFRHEINNRYRQIGLDLTPEQICVTSGCQHALFLALLATCKPGDNVAVESPAFYGVLQLLEQLQLNIVEIPSDPVNGVIVEAIEQICERWDISALVVSPAFATPTGATIPEEHKREIIQIANRHQLAVIEDDIYGELGFETRPVPLKAYDTQDRVILCSSLSKSLSRDLRMGWISGGRWHHRITQLRMVSQLAASQALQQGIASFMAEGHFRRHLLYFQQQLKRQRNQLLSIISHHWPLNVRCSVPQGGLAIWVELDQSVDTIQLYKKLLKQAIIITPGSLFTASKNFNHFLRISFNHPYKGQRKEALLSLGQQLES